MDAPEGPIVGGEFDRARAWEAMLHSAVAGRPVEMPGRPATDIERDVRWHVRLRTTMPVYDREDDR